MAHLQVLHEISSAGGFRHNKNTLIVMELNIFQLRNKKQKRYSCYSCKMSILMVLRLRVGGGGSGLVRVEGGVGGWLYEEGNGNTVIGFFNCFFHL